MEADLVNANGFCSQMLISGFFCRLWEMALQPSYRKISGYLFICSFKSLL